jgi:hypothetical protein
MVLTDYDAIVRACSDVNALLQKKIKKIEALDHPTDEQWFNRYFFIGFKRSVEDVLHKLVWEQDEEKKQELIEEFNAVIADKIFLLINRL